MPVNRAGATLIVAVSDPSNLIAIEDIKFMTGYNVEMVVASERDIKAAIDKHYDQSASLADVMGDMELEDLEIIGDEEDIDVSSLERATEDAPVVKMVNAILQDAIRKKSQRYSYRALREGFQGALPYRRYPVRGHEAASQAEKCDYLTYQDHVRAGHCRETAAPGRANQDQAGWR